MTRRNPNTNELLIFTNTEPKKIYKEIVREKPEEFVIIIKPESFTADIYHIYTQRYFTKHYPKLTLSRESMKIMGWL